MIYGCNAQFILPVSQNTDVGATLSVDHNHTLVVFRMGDACLRNITKVYKKSRCTTREIA